MRYGDPYDGAGDPADDEPWDGHDLDESRLELITPEDFLPANPFPLDAQRMGIDRWSDDAGMIAIASSLDSSKRSHKIVAWVMLLGLTGWLLLQLAYELT